MVLQEKLISEWSERGDPVHAWYSYELVRESLTKGQLNGMSCAVYPQGSYANKTNIAADSDVDMVIALRSAFYSDKDELSPPELLEYEKYYESASQTWRNFHDVVVSALRADFFIQEGGKCVKVRSSLLRLPADVLISLDYRYYKSFPSFAGQSYIDGVQFYASGGRKIVNYPKRHIRSCARKNNQTRGMYRRVVRVAKNARNSLIASDGTEIKAGTSPSYFLESLLWNVPDSYYSTDTGKGYRQVIDWLHQHPGALAKMDFPNGMGKLFGNMRDTAWTISSAQAIIKAMYLQLGP